MSEATVSDPRADLRHSITRAIEHNEAFLHKNAPDVYDQLVSLVNDAIDAMISASGVPTREADYVERATAFSVYHALLPLRDALLLDLLVGNLPGSFLLLRLLLETLVKCWTPDRDYPQLPFFADRLQALDGDKATTTQMIRTMGEVLQDGGAGIMLWRDLSRQWAHMPGYSRRIVTAVTTTGGTFPLGHLPFP